MAGDWIKMRGNLWDDPRVSALCDMTDSSEASIVGGLYWLWATADQHTEDGVLPGLTTKGIDRKTGIKGFGDALVAIGWIADEVDGIRIVRFDEHNGTSAKRRCMEAQRKANTRNLSAHDADNNKTDGGQNPPNCGAREREEKEKSQQPISENTAAVAISESQGKSPPPRHAAIAILLRSLEKARGKVCKATSADPRIIGWAERGVTDDQIREAYGIAVADREAAEDSGAISAGFLDVFVAKLLNPPEAKTAVKPPVPTPKRQCCGKNDDGTPCSGHVEGEIMGRPWCRKHQEYAMDNSNFRQREAA